MIGPAGFQAAPKSNRPAYGTTPIRCGKLKCKWRGFESDLLGVPSKKFGHGVTDKVCPTCGANSYYFMTEKQIVAWERAKAAAQVSATPAGSPVNPKQEHN